MSDFAPSIVEQIIQRLYQSLADGPAQSFDSLDEVLGPDQLPAIVITPFEDAPTDDPENVSIRSLKFFIEMLAKQEETIPARTKLDQIYVWAVKTMMADQYVNELVISITEGRETWDFPGTSPGFGYKAIEFDVRYARNVEDPTQ